MYLQIKDVAAMIAQGGVHPETARHRVSHFAQECLISFRREGPNTRPNRYPAESAAVAIVLSALQDCGVQNLETLRDVSAIAHCEMRRCLAGLARGESWTAVVSFYRHSQGIFRDARLVSHDESGFRPMAAEFIPRGAIVIVVDEMLSPIVRHLSARKGH